MFNLSSLCDHGVTVDIFPELPQLEFNKERIFEHSR